LKKKYASQLSQVKELFPNMAPEDILLELQENNGDLEVTVDKITEGRFPFSTHSMLHLPPLPPHNFLSRPVFIYYLCFTCSAAGFIS
jgi:hypothetical protein